MHSNTPRSCRPFFPGVGCRAGSLPTAASAHRGHIRPASGRQKAGVCALLQQVLKDRQVRRVHVVRHASGAVQRRPALAAVSLVDLRAPLLHQEPHALHLHRAWHYQQRWQPPWCKVQANAVMRCSGARSEAQIGKAQAPTARCTALRSVTRHGRCACTCNRPHHAAKWPHCLSAAYSNGCMNEGCVG